MISRSFNKEGMKIRMSSSELAENAPRGMKISCKYNTVHAKIYVDKGEDFKAPSQ